MIIISYITKRQLYEIVDNLKQQFGITAWDYPLNIFKFCKRTDNVEIRAVPFVTPDLRGMVHISKTENENHVILVNSNKSFVEQNFHGFHELMHIPTADMPGTILQCYEKLKPSQDSYIEWLANEGAAEFLLPYKTLLPLVKRNYSSMTKGLGTWTFCQETSELFQVSPTVVQNRLDTLKYEIHQYIDGTPINDIEILSHTKQIARGIEIESLTSLENKRLFHIVWGENRNTQDAVMTS